MLKIEEKFIPGRTKTKVKQLSIFKLDAQQDNSQSLPAGSTPKHI